MRTVEVAVLSEAVNNWIVQTPGRKYPGVVVQGDSLHHLQYLSSRIAKIAETMNDEDLTDLATELNDLLTGRVAAFERVLAESGFVPEP